MFKSLLVEYTEVVSVAVVIESFPATVEVVFKVLISDCAIKQKYVLSGVEKD